VTSAPKGSPVVKIVVIVLAVLALGGLAVVGGMVYIGHKVVNKIEDKAAEAGISTSDLGKHGNTPQGDPCRFLSKADVSAAIGVAIVETKSGEASCDYMAKGNIADMTAKHLTTTLDKSGATAQQKEMIEKMAGGLFHAQEKADSPGEDAEGNTVVMAVSFDANSARAQMKLNSKVLGGLGPESGSTVIPDVGDEAFVASNGIMFVRKGDTLIRIMFTSCPCSTKEITPLAKKLADSL
jgi:hypothetical protein